MTFSETLAERIENVILDGIANGSINRESVSQIIVGPSPNFESLLVWFNDSWDNYPSCSRHDSFAEVPCFEWLERIDSVFPQKTRPHEAPPTKHYEFDHRVSFLDETLNQAYRNERQWIANDVIEAIKWVIRRQKLGEFKNVVGFMAYGLSKSGHGDCVGFYHPEGTPSGLLPVFPIDEQRSGGISNTLDGFGWLTPDGLRMFYPEIDRNKGAEQTQKYFFSDMLCWFKNEGEEDLSFRLKTASFTITIRAGYTLEGWCWVETNEINNAIEAHFLRHPELRRDNFPPSLDQPAQEIREWLTRNNPLDFFEDLLKKERIEEAESYLRILPQDSKWQGRLYSDFADFYISQSNHKKALELLSSLTGHAMEYCIREKFDALLGLKKYRDIIEWCQSLIKDNINDNDLPVYIALTYALMGDCEKSLAEQNNLKKDEGSSALKMLAKALVLDQKNDAQAITVFEKAIINSWRIKKFVNLYISGSPRLKAALDQIIAEERKNEEHGVRLAAIRKELNTTPEALETDNLLRKSYFSETDATVSRWQAIGTKYNVKGLLSDGKIKKFLRDGKDRIWGLAQTKGLIPIEVSANGVVTLGKAVLSTGSLEDGAIQDDWIFCADYRNGLSIFDVGGNEAKHVITVGTRSETNTAITVEGNLAAIIAGNHVEVFDVSNPAQPCRLSTIGLGLGPFENPRVNDLLLKNKLLYACGRPYALMIVDLSEPSHPKIISATSIKHDPSINRWSAERIHLLDDGSVLVSDGSRCLLHFEVKDSQNPRLLAHHLNDGGNSYDDLNIVHLAKTHKESFEYLAMAESVSLVWRLRLRPGQPIEVVGVTPTADESGKPDNYFYVNDFLILSDDRYLVFGDHYFGVLKKVQIPALKASCVAAIQKSAPPLSSWIKNTLNEFQKSRPNAMLGVIAMAPIADDQISLTFAPEQTISAAEGAFATFASENKQEQEKELPNYDFKIEGIEKPDSLDDAQKTAFFLTLKGAYSDLIRNILSELSRANDLSIARGGRVYFVEKSQYEVTVVACKEFPGRIWSPWRPKIKAPERVSLADKLKDYRARDALNVQIRKDPEVYAELVGLAKTGNRSALISLWQNRDLRRKDVLKLMLDALSVHETQLQAASCLLDEKNNPEVHSRLMELWSSLPHELYGLDSGEKAELSYEGAIALCLAPGLSLYDDDRMFNLAKALMTKSDLNYRNLDTICEVCDTLQNRIAELKSLLLEVLNQLDEEDNRLAAICKQLFRAGHRQLPAKLLKQSHRQKRDEKYSDVKIGIAFLDDREPHQYSEPKVERMYTGWMLAEKIHQLLHGDRPRESVWPSGLAMEPHAASWRHVLNAALPYIIERNELDAFIELLGRRLESQSAFYPDQRFILGLLDYTIDTKKQDQVARTTRITTLILNSPAFDDKTKKKVTAKIAFDDLARGFELLKADKLVEARQIADRLLASNLKNGQIFFFDARLRWKETKIPQTGIEAAQTYLKQIGHDPAGRARLNNLIGCALDELGRVAEALPYFEEAAKEHEEDPIYLCNMAEAYEKLGKIPEALGCASEALRRKAKSAVCERIVQKYKDVGSAKHLKI